MTQFKFSQRPFEKNFNTLIEDLINEIPGFCKNDFNKTEWKGSVPVNVKETDSFFEMEVIAPGFNKEDFKINLENDVLTVSAEKKEEEKKENEKQVRKEYVFKSFKRSFTIDDKIDATKTDASYINGVLRLNFPKKAEVRPSATEIKIS